MQKLRKINRIWLIAIALVILSGLGAVTFIPRVRARVEKNVREARERMFYFFKPPDEAVFQPEVQTNATPVLKITREPTSTPGPPTPTIPTHTPTITPTPLPEVVELPGVIYVDQHNRWNYCGPANVTMALNFWGWPGNRDDVAKVVKPGTDDSNKDFIQRGFPDKNVMAYEMVDFVNDETEFRALMRYGGDMDLIKRLIAAGFPVVAEKGYYERDYAGKIVWLGHYLFTTGYDENRGGFIVQDTWVKPGKNLLSQYEIYQEGWRSFNYLFFVVYPPDREAEVLDLLGPWANEDWANQHALDIANEEIGITSGNDLFFAWFNKGTSHVQLRQYSDAAAAYDQAFTIYAGLDDEEYRRPFHMMWYQTGPYFAYYWSGRYQDVINLANTTLNETIAEPTLEESLLWRGRAYYMLGNTQAAIEDYRAALEVHTGWLPAVQALQDLGLQP
jgi:tetratricopeptide (TPR) repeat protein